MREFGSGLRFLKPKRFWEAIEPYAGELGSGDIELLSANAVSEIIVGYEASPDLIELARAFKTRGANPRIFRAFPHPQRQEMAREEL